MDFLLEFTADSQRNAARQRRPKAKTGAARGRDKAPVHIRNRTNERA
jgi:hypothetical protein